MPPRTYDDLEIELSGLLGAAGPPPDPGDGLSSFSPDMLTGSEQGPEVFEMGEDGEFRAVYPEDDLMSPVPRDQAHNENLAELLDSKELATISSDLLKRIEDDIESRKPWEERYRRGMEMMGLIDDEMDDGPFPGASTAVMPIISEAVVQFWARSLGEQVPSAGPVRAALQGVAAGGLMQRAERVATYMNHEMMYVDRSWYTNHSRMLFALPTAASCFKKVYRDQDLGQNASDFIHAEDFITNYEFTDLESAPRYTHRIWKTRNELRRAQVSRVYRDVDLTNSSGSSENLSDATEIRLEASDFTHDGLDMSDARHEIFEVHCERNLPGFEDIGPDGRPTGIMLPYIITIDKESEQVLSIYRAWKEDDPLKRRRVMFVQYDYLPGPGFYGLSLLHLIGGLQEAATGALRLIVDGSATASLQGGFVSKDASIRGQDLTVEPGVWKHVDASHEDLQKAFFNPPLKEPSGALFNVLGLLTERAEKFASTTEMMTGDMNTKNAPVGSTLAILEQGGKVFSAIHRGLHKSLTEELRLRYELIQEYVPQEGYPFPVDAGDGNPNLMFDDFVPSYAIIPVSDPNIFSQAQRTALNQAVYELAINNPDLIKRDVALKRVLEGMRVPDVEELLIQHEPPAPMDPISEIQALLRGEPVQAYPDQDHLAHIQHYMAFMQNPQFGGNPQISEQIAGPGMALIGQRLAYAWATHARALGAPAQYLPPPMQGEEQAQTGAGVQIPDMSGQMAGAGGPMMGMPDMGIPGMAAPGGQPQIPPEQLAKIAAQIAPQMAKVPGMPAPGAEAQDQMAQAKAAESQAKTQAIQQKAQTDQESAQAKIQLQAMQAQSKIEIERIQAASKQAIEEMKAQAKLQIEMGKAEQADKASKRKQAISTTQAYAKARDAEAKLQADQAKVAQAMAHKDQEALIKASTTVAKSEQDARIKEQDAQVRQSVAKKAGRKKSGGDE